MIAMIDTLRDRLAAMAMQGLMANPEFSNNLPGEIAAIAYEQADHMVAYSKLPPMDVTDGPEPEESEPDEDSHPEDVARLTAAALEAIAERSADHLVRGHVDEIRSLADRIREYWGVS